MYNIIFLEIYSYFPLPLEVPKECLFSEKYAFMDMCGLHPYIKITHSFKNIRVPFRNTHKKKTFAIDNGCWNGIKYSDYI